MFEYQQNTLCVAASWLYQDAGVLSEGNYKWLCSQGKIEKLTTGGNGRRALVAYESIPERFKNKIREIVGDPYEQVKHIIFADYIKPDLKADEFFASYLLEDGKNLTEPKQKQYCHQAIIFNTVQHIATNVVVQRKFGGHGHMWAKMLEAIQNLPNTWLHKRYKNQQSFKRAYKKYVDNSYEGIIENTFLNNNSAKITDDSARWLLAQYCLPIKYSVPELIDIYDEVRGEKGWKSVTERSVLAWLNKPEQKRIWFLARHGRDEYMKVYGHTLTRDKQEWFPNAYWAIDGTKLDLVHFANNSQKMAAELKINLVIDIYSEKIIGWDLALSENHSSHFRAVKQAVNAAGCRPFLFTYDKQSGHTSARMQDLYSRLVAKGGTHYSHKVGRKSSPVEQILNRFQQQVISKMWFSDKQSIKVRRLDNKPNTDFIVEYKEALPTREELFGIVKVLIDRWNSMKQRGNTFTRNQLFEQEAPKREEIQPLDMVSMFWIDETKPKKYYGHGMPMTVEGVDYEFEVYTPTGEIDLDFRQKYVGEKLIVRYDPEYLNEMIELYELTSTGEKRFVAHATPKRKHQVVPILMHPETDKWRHKDMEVKEFEFNRDLEAYERLVAETGIGRDSLVESQELMIKMQGKMPKELQMATDSDTLKTRLNKY
jgi:hypothetical protein